MAWYFFSTWKKPQCFVESSHDFPGEHGDTKTEEDPDGRAEEMMVQLGQWKRWWMVVVAIDRSWIQKVGEKKHEIFPPKKIGCLHGFLLVEFQWSEVQFLPLEFWPFEVINIRDNHAPHWPSGREFWRSKYIPLSWQEMNDDFDAWIFMTLEGRHNINGQTWWHQGAYNFGSLDLEVTKFGCLCF